MKKIRYIAISLLFIIIACKDDHNPPVYEREAILTSEKILQGVNYITFGFSFEKGENILYTITSGTLPDIVVTHFIDLENNLIVTFTSPINDEAFYLNDTFTSEAASKTWFDNYKEAPESGYKILADTVKTYQVWTVQTVNKKYAKLLIKEIRLMQDSPVADYVEVVVDYKYQPDGSRIF